MEPETAKNGLSCGVDEAGRGPVIGPLVVSIVCGYDDDLGKIGVKDSKALTRNSRTRLFDLIIQSSSHYAIREITPEELNDSMSRINLNQIEEDSYASLIEAAPLDCTVYVDSFDVNPDRLSQKLSSRTGKRVVCRHKADSLFPSVSAASILSKVTRDRRIEDLEKTYGRIGSGYPSDPVTIRFLEDALTSGKDISRIVRTKWKTYTSMVGRLRNRKLI